MATLGFHEDYRPNWFQLGTQAMPSNVALASAAVYACTSVIAEEIARIPIGHYRLDGDGGRTELFGTDVTRILRRPNHYQSRVDLMLQLSAGFLLDGNGYGLATRDTRGRIEEVRVPISTSVAPLVDPDSQSVFYEVAGGPLILPGTYPKRNVLHIRKFTSVDGITGLTPLRAAGHSVTHAEQIQSQQTDFFGNQARPGGILTTDQEVGAEQQRRLREQWERAAETGFRGKTAVLDHGFNYQALTLSAADVQLIEQLKWTAADVARVYRVPGWMVGLDPPTFNNAETMARLFIAQTLGFWVEHIERALEQLFALPASEVIEFKVESALLRSELAARMKAYRDGVQGGIYSPNEVRAMEGLSPVEGGDQVFLQQQMEPVEVRADPPEPVAPAPPPAPAEDPEMEAARARIEALEVQIARQRLEHAAEVGPLRAELSRHQEPEGAA